MNFLVTGGAGYIGSFMTRRLLDEGHSVIVADSLERGKEAFVDKRAKLFTGNLLDKEFVKNLFDEKFDAVFHFAGYISMAESVERPDLYLKNNVISSMNLASEMIKTGQNNFIFSSTAGVYGVPQITPIPEDHPKVPDNPYGESKLTVEVILDWYKKNENLNFIALRYFNAAGASLDGSIGEDHIPETHIIPLAIKAMLTDQNFSLYGVDYDTPDGSAVRDYIHVLDLVEAHLLAFEKIKSEKGGFYYNVGTGVGYSNREIVKAVQKLGNSKINVVEKGRRSGDVPVLVADPTKIKKELGFSPKYSDIETIIKSAISWHKKQFKI